MSIKKRSIITGLLYLSLAIIGPLGFLILPKLFTEATDIVSYTSNHLLTLISWFLVEVVIIVIEIFLTVNLWKLLNVYHKKLSLTAYLFRMLMILIMVINSIFLLAVLFTGGQNADLWIPVHSQWVFIWQIAFSIHIVFIGYIVLKYVGSIWRYLGIFLLLGALGYFIDSLNHLIPLSNAFMTSAASLLLVAVMIGEIGMAIALLMKKIVTQ